MDIESIAKESAFNNLLESWINLSGKDREDLTLVVKEYEGLDSFIGELSILMKSFSLMKGVKDKLSESKNI